MRRASQTAARPLATYEDGQPTLGVFGCPHCGDGYVRPIDTPPGPIEARAHGPGRCKPAPWKMSDDDAQLARELLYTMPYDAPRH